jgi:hypothetical protein
MSDRPDYTLPVSIEAVTIESLPIEVVAWSIGTIAVDIASQTVGNIGVDIKAATAKVAITITSTDITGNIPIDIKAQTIGNIAVNIAASAVTLNVAITSSTVTLNVNISSQSAFNLNVNIAASAATLNVNITGSTTINVNISSITAGVTFNVNITGSTTINVNAAQSGTWTVNASITGSVTLNVNITGSTTIKIQGVEGGTAVTVAGTVSISGTVNVTGSVTVSGTVSISGTVNVTGTVTISGTVTITGNVTITSGTVNIQTSGGANIVIDKLTQAAYTERQSTLSNNGASASMTSSNLTYKRGKFFPRGARGFINTVEIYCENFDTVAHTFTVKLSPMPGMGPVATFTLSVAAGSSEAWRAITVRRFWNYDSLFIWVSSDNDTHGWLGYDSGTPYDYYLSTDEVTWSHTPYRWWFRVNFTGETVGDLPVSGTVNTVEIPVSSVGSASGSVIISAGASVNLISLSRPGRNLHAHFWSSTKLMQFHIICDGIYLQSKWDDHFMPQNLSVEGYTASTPGVSLLKESETEGADNEFTISFPFEWKQTLVIAATNSSSAARNAAVSLNYKASLG